MAFDKDFMIDEKGDAVPAVNEYMTSKFDTQNSLVEDVTGGAIATVADFGVSVYNSLPFTENADTQDVISKISQNAARVYEEHPDTIDALSFIGGSFIPSGLAIKGMGALRAGAKGASWFSDLGKAQNLAKIDEAVRLGAEGTKAYRQTRNAVLLQGVANNVLDAAAAEVAVLATMNASPLMEDYFENPVQNFGISLAFGGVIGGAAAGIADNFAINKIRGNIFSEAIGEVAKDYKAISPAEPSIGKLQIYNANIKNLEKIASPDYEAAPIVKEYANNFLLEERAKQSEFFDKIVDEDIAALPKEVKDKILSAIVNDTRQAGGDKIKFFTVKDSEVNKVVGKDLSSIKKPLSNDFSPVQDVDPTTGKVLNIEDVIFHPEFNSFSTVEESANFLRASATGITEEEINKIVANGAFKLHNVDASLALANNSSAYNDLQYLTALKAVDKLDAKGLHNLVIAPDDPFVLNALQAKYKKNPEMFEGVSFKVTKNKPSFESFQEQALQTAKVKPTHIQELTNAASESSVYNLIRNESSLSVDAKQLLQYWVKGEPYSKKNLRVGVDSFLRGTPSAGGFNKVASEIYNSKESVALRKHLLADVADKDGNVYLYRGVTGKQVGHSPVESYTPVRSVAKGFADEDSARLFKIHVDDILGTVTEPEGLQEFEYLVGSAARPAVLEVPVTTAKEAFNVGSTKSSVQNWTMDDVSKAFVRNKDKTISYLLERGVPIESIAIRTNTPVKTIQGYATGLREGETIDTLSRLGDDFSLSTYNSADGVAQYLAPEAKALRIKSNVNKLEYSKLASNIDINSTVNMNREYMDTVLATSKSFTAKTFYDQFFGSDLSPGGMRPLLDMLRSSVGDFNNGKLGNAFFQSSDFFLRNTAMGKVVSTIGKNMQDIASKSAQRLTIPLTQKMAQVAKSETALIEANVAMVVNAGLSGNRIYRNGQFFQTVTEEGKQVLKAVQYQGKDFQIQTQEVRDLFDSLAESGRELYELKNSVNQILGRGKLNDLGFWVPAFNPKNKYIAYVWDNTNNSTKLLWGNTDKELIDNIAAYKASVSPDLLNSGKVRIVENKKEQRLWNELNNRLDPLTMEIANVEKFHTGASQTAIVRANTDIFGEVIGGYNNYIESHTKRLGELLMHDTTDVLDKLSKYNTRYFDEQPLSEVGKLTHRPEDGANIVKNILLGNNNLSEYTNWKRYNEVFETVTNWGLDTVSKTFKAAVEPFSATLGKGKLTEENMKKLDYEAISRKLEAEGIVNPWAVFDKEAANLFGVAKLQESKNTTRRLIYASNAFAATMALRVGDIAQPLVNAMSLPILTYLAKAQNHPDTFLGVAKGTSKAHVGQVMYEGARLSNSAEGARLAQAWEKAGYFESYVSEANAALRQSRSFEPGAIAHVENALDSNMVNFLSKPADVAESMVRRQTMFTGAVLAKRLYPELNDQGVTIFARDFMDRAVGNYHAPQRPVFFQGTAGVALGLFQTYMLTLGQSIYRHLEFRNYKELGKAALLQSSIFGGTSMPGFDMVSQAIGDHFSDENIDLTTGTFKAVGDPTATALLYGIPSSLGPAFYTRGDIAPRAVSPFSGPQNIAAVNMIGQSVGFLGNLAKAGSADNPDIGRTIGEAVSLQSVSRPLARVAELFTGYSTTQAGRTIETPNEVYTFTGVAARLLSTRPIEEAKVREAIHLNTAYGQLDREHRQVVIKELKTAIRNGTLDNEKIQELALNYMSKSGTPTGWRSAVNTAIQESNTTGKAQMLDKLKPDNPVMYMIDSLDGE